MFSCFAIKVLTSKLLVYQIEITAFGMFSKNILFRIILYIGSYKHTIKNKHATTTIVFQTTETLLKANILVKKAFNFIPPKWLSQVDISIGTWITGSRPSITLLGTEFNTLYNSLLYATLSSKGKILGEITWLIDRTWF